MAQEQGSSFFQKTTDTGIAKAEAELNAVLEAERPDEAGKNLKNKDKTPPADDEVIDGHNWKERYGNLQRLYQKKTEDWKKDKKDLEDKIADLATKVDTISRKAAPAELPQTEEEVEALRKENPGAYNAIVRIARSIAEELVEQKTSTLSSEFEQVRKGQQRNAKEAAAIELQRRHPDLDLKKLQYDEQFQTWIQSKPQVFQDALFSNSEDVDSASEVLTMYKIAFPPKKKAGKNLLGAEDVNTKSTPELPSGDKGWDYTESEIDAKDRSDPRWFDKNQEAIDKAIRAGRVLMDISDPIGAARRQAAAGI